MSLSIRAKLFWVSFAIVAVAGLSMVLVLETQLRQWLEERLENQLLTELRTSAIAVEVAQAEPRKLDCDGLADRLGGSTQARVTLIHADGTVCGDSHVERASLQELDNHGQRPEVQAASPVTEGRSRRFSETLQTTMVYRALSLSKPSPVATVRLAIPMTEVDELLERLRTILILACIAGLVCALSLSGLASLLVNRLFAGVVRNIRAMVHGRGGESVELDPPDLGSIAQTVNHMARELEDTVAKLAHERDTFQTLIETMDAGVIELDADRTISVVNSAGRAMLDTETDPVGRVLSEAVRNPELQELVGQAEQGRSAVEEVALREQGPLSKAIVRCTPRKDGGVVVTLQDITELRRLESVRRDFVANVSHELRTPVSVIRANAETLLDGGLSDRERAPDFVEGVLRNAERLTQLITDLLDLARVESGAHKVELMSVHLHGVVESVLATVSERARHRGTLIQNLVPQSLKIQGDIQVLDQVLLNIVDNALKYTPEGSSIEVRFVDTPDEGFARIEIADNGPGLEEEHLHRVFERFYRVDAGRSRALGGTGLGLAIVKHMVVAMGGRVGAKANPQQGVIFWFELPRT